MRIRTLTGLAVASAASVGALALAGTAYAGNDPEPESVVQIVTDECPDAGSERAGGDRGGTGTRQGETPVPGGSL